MVVKIFNATAELSTFTLLLLQFGNGVCNITGENSRIFSLIRMC